MVLLIKKIVNLFILGFFCSLTPETYSSDLHGISWESAYSAMRSVRNKKPIELNHFFPRAHLVPVFSFGENEVYDQVENPRGTWLRWLQENLQKIMGVSLPLFHARGIFQYSFGLMPYRKPINTVGE